MFSEEPKESLYIWATFGRKFVAKNFQKSPNLVTLQASDSTLSKELHDHCKTPALEFWPNDDAVN